MFKYFLFLTGVIALAQPQAHVYVRGSTVVWRPDVRPAGCRLVHRSNPRQDRGSLRRRRRPAGTELRRDGGGHEDLGGRGGREAGRREVRALGQDARRNDQRRVG